MLGQFQTHLDLLQLSAAGTEVDKISKDINFVSIPFSPICTVLNPVVSVAMGAVTLSKIANRSNETIPFSLSFNCSQIRKINLRFDDESVPNSVRGDLSLSASSTAKGVAVGIKFNQLPVVINRQLIPLQFSDGKNKIDFVAYYLPTNSEVIKAGTANAQASFTVIYN